MVHLLPFCFKMVNNVKTCITFIITNRVVGVDILGIQVETSSKEKVVSFLNNWA